MHTHTSAKIGLPALLASLLVLLTSATHAQVNFTGFYSENFNSMGTSGTTAPAGWALKTGNSGTTNTTWSSSITANGSNSVASMVATSGVLTAVTTPSATNNNGFNAAAGPGTLTNRVLSTSPTTVSGGAIELSLKNMTGLGISDLLLGWDVYRYNAASSANELPGYTLFYSLNGTTWANGNVNFTASSTIPNTAGVTTVPAAQLSLASTWNSGSNLLLRWVDDNAIQTSPDQIIGLDNVSVAAIPEPSVTALLLGAGALMTGFVRRRRLAA